MTLKLLQRPWLVMLMLCIVTSSCVSTPATTPESSPTTAPQTQTGTPYPIPSLTPFEPTLTQTNFAASAAPTQYSPYDQEISLEIKDGESNEEIAKKLLSRWLDKLTDEEIDAHWRLKSYEITQVINVPNLSNCTNKYKATFVMFIGVDFETVYPMLCSSDCEHSDWAAGGGTIIDPFHESTAFLVAVYKSGNVYSMKVLTDAPPC